MDVQNIGDILHIIILPLILVWLFYHQWMFTKMLDLMREIVDKLLEDEKEADRNCNRKDSDFQLKR